MAKRQMEWGDVRPSEKGWYWFAGDVVTPESDGAKGLLAYGLLRTGDGGAETFVSSMGKWRTAQLKGLWAGPYDASEEEEEIRDIARMGDEELVRVLAERARIRDPGCLVAEDACEN